MKHIINYKSILHLMCITGALLFASSCSENKTADSGEETAQDNMERTVSEDQAIVVVDNDNGNKFLMETAEMQLQEISLGKLAQEKGSSPHVKELGKMMETDHGKTLVELTALAQTKSATIPSAVTEDGMDAYEKLAEKTGNDFGKAYSDMMVEHHEDAIEMFEKASNDSNDPEIKAWAAQKLPGLRTHLEHAKACKEECDKMKD